MNTITLKVITGTLIIMALFSVVAFALAGNPKITEEKLDTIVVANDKNILRISMSEST